MYAYRIRLCACFACEVYIHMVSAVVALMFVLPANYVVSLVYWWTRNGPPCAMFSNSVVLRGYNIHKS